jgi:hypothetical protein
LMIFLLHWNIYRPLLCKLWLNCTNTDDDDDDSVEYDHIGFSIFSKVVVNQRPEVLAIRRRASSGAILVGQTDRPSGYSNVAVQSIIEEEIPKSGTWWNLSGASSKYVLIIHVYQCSGTQVARKFIKGPFSMYCYYRCIDRYALLEGCPRLIDLFY